MAGLYSGIDDFIEKGGREEPDRNPNNQRGNITPNPNRRPKDYGGDSKIPESAPNTEPYGDDTLIPESDPETDPYGNQRAIPESEPDRTPYGEDGGRIPDSNPDIRPYGEKSKIPASEPDRTPYGNTSRIQPRTDVTGEINKKWRGKKT